MDQGLPFLKVVPAFVGLVVALCAAGTCFAQVQFRPSGGGFQVDFPVAPRVANELVSTRFGNTHGVMASHERAGVKFYAQYFDYPPSASQEGGSRLLDGLRLGRTVKGELRFEQRFLLEGNPAQREIVDWHVATQPVIVALDVLRGLRLYSIFCILERGQEDAGDVRRFFESFALLPL